MTDEAFATLIGTIATIGGTMWGVWYGARVSRQAARDLLTQQAKAEFAASFTGALVNLSGPVQEERVGTALHILQEHYPAHLAAYIRLRSVLAKEEQAAIDEAWKKYAGDDKRQLPGEREFYRFCHVLSPESDEHQFMLATKHIYSLLARTAA
jgi:hypothetical protein